jgi:hypothetical protein
MTFGSPTQLVFSPDVITDVFGAPLDAIFSPIPNDGDFGSPVLVSGILNLAPPPPIVPPASGPDESQIGLGRFITGKINGVTPLDSTGFPYFSL